MTNVRTQILEEPVILSEAKNLCVALARFFASLRMTGRVAQNDRTGCSE